MDIQNNSYPDLSKPAAEDRRIEKTSSFTGRYPDLSKASDKGSLLRELRLEREGLKDASALMFRYDEDRQNRSSTRNTRNSREPM